jgi:DNA-binding NtrC family response regulator
MLTYQRNSRKSYFSKKIAVVDDEGDIAQMFTDALKSNGYRAKAFTDPLVAFDQICSDHSSYGLVLSDVRMPNLSGIELATKLREKYKKIKIILMSAYETEYIRISNMKNIDYFISKPAHIEKVLGIIEDVILPPKIKIEEIPTM